MHGANKVYFENLDGLRTIACGMVLMQHSGLRQWLIDRNPFDALDPLVVTLLSGGMGVRCFFVLSGFLITYLLFQELHGSTKTISIRNFYLRRVLRIWPLYFLVLAIAAVVYFALTYLLGQTPNWGFDPLLYLFFLGNFDLSPNTPLIVGITWSISIEEQFYLIWPLLILTLRHWAVLAIGVIYCGSILFISFGTRPSEVYVHTLSNFLFLSTGALAAYLVWYRPLWLESFRQIPKPAILAIYALGLVVLSFEIVPLPPAVIWALVAFFFAFLILEQCYAQHSPVKLKRFRWLSGTGKYTYALYLLHPLPLLVASRTPLFTSDSPLLRLIGGLVVVGSAYLMSVLSYRYFEQPFLRLKARFE